MTSEINNNIEFAEAEERKRLQQKAEHDTAVMRDSLYQFIDILNPKDISCSLDAEEDDPLFSASLLVGNHLGLEIKKPLNYNASSAKGLDAIARTSGFRVRQVALKDEWWHNDNGPLLAYIEEDKRPVALIPASHGRYRLHDVKNGIITEINSKVAKTIAPFAQMFYRSFPQKILKGKEIIKFAFWKCKGELWIVITMGLCGSILGLITPIVAGIVFDTVIPEAQHSQLWQIAIILTGCAFATVMFELTKAIALLRLETKMDFSVQTGIMDRLLSLPVPFFRDYSAGDLAQRVMAINIIRQTLSGVTVQTILSSLFSMVNLILIFWYDWKLALVAIVVTLLGVLIIGAISYTQIRYQKDITKIQGEISGIILQLITGISKIRVSDTENRAFAIWSKKFTAMRKLLYKAGDIANVASTIHSTFPIITSMSIFAWIMWNCMDKLSLGNFISFNTAFATFQNALLQMCMTLISVLNIVPLYERTLPIFNAIPEVDEAKENPGTLSGDIEINHVNFSYQPDAQPVLKDISLHVKQGQFIAVVGSSGAGKSTLLRMLLGFEKPTSGSIYYDGQDILSSDIREIRRQIGVVLQNSQLLGGDIFKNIVGSSNLTIDDAWEAAKMVGFDKDIKEMPMGMHTVISIGGGNLSGGQKQRLLIARAIVHKPRIIFFDEATSSLDNETQDIVSKSLEALKSTRIVIAHRLTTIINADCIYVLKNGEIIETGTYNDLMNKKGYFSELAMRQLV